MKRLFLFLLLFCCLVPVASAGYGYAIFGTHWVEGGGSNQFRDDVILPYVGDTYYSTFLQLGYTDLCWRTNPSTDTYRYNIADPTWRYNGDRTFTTPSDAKGGANLFSDSTGGNVNGRLYGNSEGKVIYVTSGGTVSSFSDLFPQENGQISATAFTIGSGIHAGKYIMVANSQGEIKVYKRTATGVERCPQFEFGLDAVTGNGLLTITTFSESDGVCILMVEKEDGTKSLYHLANTIYNLNARFVYEDDIIVDTDINGYNINLETSSIGLEVPYSYNNKINNININVENLSKIEMIQFSVDYSFDGMDLTFINVDETKKYSIYEDSILTYTSRGNETSFNYTTDAFVSGSLKNIQIITEENNTTSNDDDENNNDDDSGGSGGGGGGGSNRDDKKDEDNNSDEKSDNIIQTDSSISIADKIDLLMDETFDLFTDFENVFGIDNKENEHKTFPYLVIILLIILALIYKNKK